jgi:hypothetical protein
VDLQALFITLLRPEDADAYAGTMQRVRAEYVCCCESEAVIRWLDVVGYCAAMPEVMRGLGGRLREPRLAISTRAKIQCRDSQHQFRASQCQCQRKSGAATRDINAASCNIDASANPAEVCFRMYSPSG